MQRGQLKATQTKLLQRYKDLKHWNAGWNMSYPIKHIISVTVSS